MFVFGPPDPGMALDGFSASLFVLYYSHGKN